MAAKELYDYLSTIASDVDQTLSLDPQTEIHDIITKNDAVHEFDDASEERIGLSGSGVVECAVEFRYDLLNASDSGTVVQFWADPLYGDGRINSFKFSHPDGHTYVVRFDCDMRRIMTPTFYSNPTVRLKVLGRI